MAVSPQGDIMKNEKTTSEPTSTPSSSKTNRQRLQTAVTKPNRFYQLSFGELLSPHMDLLNFEFKTLLNLLGKAAVVSSRLEFR
jgi:hypothetical protein